MAQYQRHCVPFLAPISQVTVWASHPSTQRWREDQEFKAILGYKASLNLVWTT